MPPTRLKDPIGRAAAAVAAAADRCDSGGAAVIGVTGSHLLTSPLVLALTRRLIAQLSVSSEYSEQPRPHDPGTVVVHCLSRPPRVYQRWLKREGGGGAGGGGRGRQAVVQCVDHVDYRQHEEAQGGEQGSVIVIIDSLAALWMTLGLDSRLTLDYLHQQVRDKKPPSPSPAEPAAGGEGERRRRRCRGRVVVLAVEEEGLPHDLKTHVLRLATSSLGLVSADDDTVRFVQRRAGSYRPTTVAEHSCKGRTTADDQAQHVREALRLHLNVNESLARSKVVLPYEHQNAAKADGIYGRKAEAVVRETTLGIKRKDRSVEKAAIIVEEDVVEQGLELDMESPPDSDEEIDIDADLDI